MTPEERDLLTQSIKISEENNRILKSMRRSARFASFLRIVYWVIILGSAFGTYYFLKPYINAVADSYNSMKSSIETVKNATNKLPALPTWLGGKQ
jgi:hypothetical protein